MLCLLVIGGVSYDLFFANQAEKTESVATQSIDTANPVEEKVQVPTESQNQNLDVPEDIVTTEVESANVGQDATNLESEISDREAPVSQVSEKTAPTGLARAKKCTDATCIAELSESFSKCLQFISIVDKTYIEIKGSTEGMCSVSLYTISGSNAGREVLCTFDPTRDLFTQIDKGFGQIESGRPSVCFIQNSDVSNSTISSDMTMVDKIASALIAAKTPEEQKSFIAEYGSGRLQTSSADQETVFKRLIPPVIMTIERGLLTSEGPAPKLEVVDGGLVATYRVDGGTAAYLRFTKDGQILKFDELLFDLAF